MAAQVMAGSGTKRLEKLRPAGEGRKVKRGTRENGQIITAAGEGDIDTLVSLSHRGIDITTARDVLGDTVLHEACRYGRSYTVACILSTGIPVDVRNDYQQTALHYAAIFNEVDCIKLLCDAGATVDAKDNNGRTPLHWAAYSGNSEALYMLLVAGATVDVMDEDGDTPLADAVSRGHGDIVNILIKHKADPTKVPQKYQQKMKELLRKEEEKTRVSDNEGTNVGSSSHDPQQAQHDRKGRGKRSINRKTVFAYQQAFKKGKKAANKFKIVMLGPEGAGKTSTVHSLLSKTFQHHQPSTVGADVNTCTADRYFTTKWKQIEIQHQLENLPMQFKSKLKIFMLKNPEKSSPEKPVLSMKSEKVTPQEHSEEEEIPHEIASKAQEVVDSTEIHDEEIQITILDLGGQEIYYHIHFLFLAQEDVVFIAFNASKDLDQQVVCRQRLTRFQEKVKTRGMQTTLQTIETLMQSVYSHCGKDVDGKVYISNRIPTIVLIATHSKNLSAQQKGAIVLKFYKNFNGKPFMDHLPWSAKQAVFFVDNSARDPQVFEALKAVALEAAAPTIAKECPISYLQFEVDILKESQNKAVISKQEAYAIAEKAGLQDTLMEVLNHYTLKGILLYYPEVETLQNKVFISPQEVSDLVSSVISTHKCEPSSAKLQQVCHRYDQFGLLEEDLLDNLLHTADRYSNKSTVLGFLENFYLAVEVIRDSKFDEEKGSYATPQSGRVFLVPSMLVYNPKVVPKVRKGDIILMYHFPDMFVPENIFNEILVKMVSWCNQHGHHVHSIFHGVGCFQLKDRIQSFKLHHCLNSCSIKCYITIHRRNLADDVLDTMLQQRQQLQDHIEDCIKEAHQSHISCARPPVGYLECPLHEPEENCPPHIRLDQLTPFGDVTCPKSIDCQVVPREAYALLFVKSLNINTQPVNRTTSSENTTAEISMETNPQQFQQAACSGHEPEKMTQQIPLAASTATTTSSTANDSVDYPTLDPATQRSHHMYKNIDYSPRLGQSGILETRPEMRDLIIKVIPLLEADWEDVAYLLHYNDTKIKSIKESYNGDPHKCCRELLKDWLETSRGVFPKHWGVLLNSIAESENFTKKAEDIIEYLKKKFTG